MVRDGQGLAGDEPVVHLVFGQAPQSRVVSSDRLIQLVEMGVPRPLIDQTPALTAGIARESELVRRFPGEQQAEGLIALVTEDDAEPLQDVGPQFPLRAAAFGEGQGIPQGLQRLVEPRLDPPRRTVPPRGFSFRPPRRG